MLLTKPFAQLASNLRERKRARDGKAYHLFLGAACARAAGKPLEAVSSSLTKLLERKPMWASAVAGAGASSGWTPDSLLTNLGPEHRQQLLRAFYSRLPVPLFYQDLAALLKLGYFREVLTTNYDDLLEQAMAGAGMQPGVDMTVADLPNYWETYTQSVDGFADGDQQAPPVPSVVVVKLHGDLARRNAVITADEVAGLLRRERHVVKEELDTDLVVVGYEGESPGLEDYLSQTRGGELWWISSSNEPPERLARTRNIHIIAGEDAEVTRFFAELYHHLERQPALDALQSIRSHLPPESKTGTEPAGETAEFLKTRIRRAQVQLYELEQSLVPGEEDPSLQNQIAYQLQKIAELEDQYRSVPSCRNKITSLASTLGAMVAALDCLSSLSRSYFQQQINLIIEELNSDKPDQVAVGAALGAIGYITKRVSMTPEQQSLLHELSTFVPQALTR